MVSTLCIARIEKLFQKDNAIEVSQTA